MWFSQNPIVYCIQYSIFVTFNRQEEEVVMKRVLVLALTMEASRLP